MKDGIKTWNWRELAARASLPALALAASYGVYSFALHFAPWYFALITAFAFEMVYIGLALSRDLKPEDRARARKISYGAVGVSVLYNWTSGILDVSPGLFERLEFWQKVVLALLHGAPLAILAYFVADLLLHTEAGNSIVSLLQSQLSILQSECEEWKEANNVLLKQCNDNENVRIILQKLSNSGKPFVFSEGQFRELPDPAGRDVSALTIAIDDLPERLDVLAGCLQARKVTPAAASYFKHELNSGDQFGKADYNRLVIHILEGVKWHLNKL